MLFVSSIIRILPNFHGLRRVYRLLNSLLLNFTVQPQRIVYMKDETRLLVDLRSNTEVDAYYRGEYDASEIAIIKKIINVNEAFLDIGAFIKSKKGIGKVYAFEPFADNYDRLVGNIALNNLEDYIQPMKIGLSDHAFDGEVILRDDFLDGASTGNTSLPINNQFDKGLFKKINSCKECEEIDNILIVPAEKGVYYD